MKKVQRNIKISHTKKKIRCASGRTYVECVYMQLSMKRYMCLCCMCTMCNMCTLYWFDSVIT